MVEVIPAIIAESFDDLKEKMALVNGIVPTVQIDVCDGRFVPSKCWPYIGDDGEFEKIMNEEDGFPFWESLDFEADLMVAAPEFVAENWIRAGAKRIIIHLESSKGVFQLIKDLRNKYGYVGESAVDIEIGVSINVDTSNLDLDPYFIPNLAGRTLADFVQFMGIKKIGYQGQPFDRNVLEKINDFKTKYPEATIAVDGGVNFEDAQDIVEAGANKLVSGSALYGSDDIKGAIEEMKSI